VIPREGVESIAEIVREFESTGYGDPERGS